VFRERCAATPQGSQKETTRGKRWHLAQRMPAGYTQARCVTGSICPTPNGSRVLISTTARPRAVMYSRLTTISGGTTHKDTQTRISCGSLADLAGVRYRAVDDVKGRVDGETPVFYGRKWQIYETFTQTYRNTKPFLW
jgi:hypothetical protein